MLLHIKEQISSTWYFIKYIKNIWTNKLINNNKLGASLVCLVGVVSNSAIEHEVLEKKKNIEEQITLSVLFGTESKQYLDFRKDYSKQ